MELVDAQGRPIWRDGKPVMQEIASISRDINRVFYGRVLRNEDDTLLTRGQAKGLKIYDELKRDAHAGAVLGKRKLAVTSRPWKVEPASKKRVDKKAAELVEKAFKHLRFNNMRKRLLEATLKGYAVSEVMWAVRDGYVLPDRVMARDPRRFVFDLEGQLRLRTPEQMVEGIELPSRKFIVHRRGADDDSPYGTGVGGMLFWPVFFKRNGITFWLTFADKFGSPTALGKYPNGAEKSEQGKLLAALRAISQDAGVIVPEGMAIELLEASRSGSVDTYEKLVRYMDEQMSKAVLGETMSTTAASAGLGSNQASVQNDVRLEVAMDDGNELDETLNDTLVQWIVEFNMPQAERPTLKTSFEEPEDLVQRAQRDKTLFDMGWEPSEDYMLQTYGEGWTRKAPQPFGFDAFGGSGFGGGGFGQGGAPALPAPQQQREQPQVTTRAGAAAEEEEPQFAEGRPLQQARGFNAARQAALVEGADALAGEWPVLMKKPVEDLLAVLDETGDLQQFRDRLATLLVTDPAEQAVDTIARATFAGGVMGRGLETKAEGWMAKLARLVGRRNGR